jgi:RND family efflux transporter MFP subunit
VNESYINRVRPGQPVEATLDAYPDWRIPCRVIAIIPTADRQRSTVRVRVAFDELDPRILPQMAVKVAFRSDAEPGDGGSVLVPKGCVREEGGRDVIFVVRQGAAERRAVLVGEARDDEITIRSGVTAGERVILDPPTELEDGTPVKERSE